MFKTIEEYENRLGLLRAEKEGYLKAADDVDNNIKLLEASFVAEGFDEETAKKMPLSILGACIGKDPITTNSLVGIIGGF